MQEKSYLEINSIDKKVRKLATSVHSLHVSRDGSFLAFRNAGKHKTFQVHGFHN